MTEPLTKPPAEEGDDQNAATGASDTEKVTEDDLRDAREPPDADDDE
jgi:hypothetical protein